MFAIRGIPALVSRPGTIRLLAPRPAPAAFASRSRTSLFCAAQSKGSGQGETYVHAYDALSGRATLTDWAV